MKYLKSKLALPAPPPYFINRPRLLEAFTEREKVRLFLLTAPAGYGKTTLALQHLNSVSSVSRAWYQLDSQDQERRRFLGYLCQALSTAIPALGTAEIQNSLFDPAGSAVDLVDEICFYLQEYGGPHLWLVLDNWEAVNAGREVCKIVTRLITHGGQRWSIIITSRIKPALKIRKLQEAGRVVIISQDELAFDFEECSEVVHSRLGSRLDDSDIVNVWQLTSGWCVNVGLITESLQRRGPQYSADITAALKKSESPADYIQEELFQDLPPCFLDFLARCSIFDYLSVENCSGIVAPAKHVATNLELLKNSAIPHSFLSDTGHFRLHPLIRQAANRVLRENLSPDELNRLYRATSDYYLDQGMILEAVDLLMELPDYDSALAVLDRDWHKIVEQNGQDRVEYWLTRFPGKVRENPLYIKTMSNLLTKRGNYRRLLEYLQDKLDPARFSTDIETFGSLWANYYNALIHTSINPVYDEIKHEYDKLRSEIDSFSDIQIAILENLLSVAANQDLKIDTALEHLKKCLAKLEPRYFDNRMILANNRALYKHYLGYSYEALAELEKTVKTCIEAKSYSAVPAALAVMADIHLATGQYRQTLETVDRCIEVMKRHHVYRLGMHIYAERFKGVALWYLGNHDGGMQLIERAFRASADFNRVTTISNGLLLEFFHQLDGHGKRFVDNSVLPPKGRVNENRLIYLGKELYRAMVDKNQRRLKVLADELLQMAATTKMAPWKITAFFYLARWADRAGKSDLCLEFLRNGLETLERIAWSSYPTSNDFLSAFIFAKAVRTDTLINTATRLVTGEYEFDLSEAFKNELSSGKTTIDEAGRLLDTAVRLKIRGLSAPAGKYLKRKDHKAAQKADSYLTMTAEESLPPLSIYTLGGFSIIASGRRVVFPRRKSMLLCQLLLISHPDPVHEEVIIEHLWPENTPAKGKSNLRTCVRDLRRSLDPHYTSRGKSYIIYDDAHYALYLPDNSIVDILELKKLLRSARVFEDSGRTLSAGDREKMQDILSLFKGPFLPQQLYEQFTLEFRERIHRQFLGAAAFYARGMIADHDYEEACRILEKAMGFDPLWGEGVQLLMQARAEDGQFLSAIRIYREYETRLQNELGLEPDEEIQIVFRKLMTHYSA